MPRRQQRTTHRRNNRFTSACPGRRHLLRSEEEGRQHRQRSHRRCYAIISTSCDCTHSP